MQTLEALISLLFFLSICSTFFLSFEEPVYADDSLYRVQLVEDVWRVLYLRGNFEDFHDVDQDKFDEELERIGDEIGLCIFFSGTDFTNCRGGQREHYKTVSLSKTVICNGAPRTYAFSIGN